MSSKARILLTALLLLGACRAAPAVHPPLWQIDGPKGERAWLFGTIHALPEPVDWRSAKVKAALADADRIVLEVAAVDDDQSIQKAFLALSGCKCDIAIRDRVPVEVRASYDRYIQHHGINDGNLSHWDTWAAALTLAQYAQRDAGSDSGNGIDRAIKQEAGRRPVEEFEGADAQLRIFDSLPEAEQRDLLAAVINDAEPPQAAARRMEKAWGTGDLAAIARDSQAGFLADPQLREALLTRRNQAWTDRLVAMLGKGEHPFVAVGTAHLAGPEGLPAQLGSRGYRVTRIQ